MQFIHSKAVLLETIAKLLLMYRGPQQLDLSLTDCVVIRVFAPPIAYTHMCACQSSSGSAYCNLPEADQSLNIASSLSIDEGVIVQVPTLGKRLSFSSPVDSSAS
jgi:hypothetical protein